MPDPTREQFNAAVQRVTASHKEGDAPLSREEFYAAVTRQLSGPTSNPGTETDNPDTAFWGSLKKTASDTGSGILKGLKSYLPSMTITKPPTREDLQAGVESLTRPTPPGPSLAQNFRDLSDPTKGGEVIGQLLPMLAGSMGSRVPVRSVANTALNVGADVAESPLTNLMVTPRATHLGKLMRGVADTIGRTPRTEVNPVDRYMPNTSGGNSTPAPSAEDVPTAIKTPPTDAPRLAGKAPTLEDELLKIVESMRQPEDPRITSMPPEPSTTPGGSFKQSGKFGKSGSLGQAGGYSSGNPSRTIEDSIYESVLPRMGGTGPNGPIEPTGPGPEKPRIGFAEAVANLRSRLGARDAAGALGGKKAGFTAEDIRTLAPGPSQIPTEAQQRIEDALLKIAMERDQ